MSRYLVTGGAGFIGSHLVDALVTAGHSVRVLDDLSTGRRHNLLNDCEILEADIVDSGAVRRAFCGIDGCFHLAAIASVEYSHRHWLRSHEVNLTGAVTIFEEALHTGRRVDRQIPVVYASSAAVYGNPCETPVSERAFPTPLSAYGADKLGCEMHARVATLVHRVPSVGLRFFNVYGPRQDSRSPYSGVVSIFSDRLAKGMPVDLHGDGGQVRDFVYVADAVRALRLAMASASSMPEVFNVCTGLGTTIRSVGEIIAQRYGVAFRATCKPRRAGDLRISIGDPRKIQAQLGFNAAVALKGGIAELIAADRQRVAAE